MAHQGFHRCSKFGHPRRHEERFGHHQQRWGSFGRDGQAGGSCSMCDHPDDQLWQPCNHAQCVQSYRRLDMNVIRKIVPGCSYSRTSPILRTVNKEWPLENQTLRCRVASSSGISAVTCKVSRLSAIVANLLGC